MSPSRLIVAAAALVAFTVAASAHVTLEKQEAAVGGSYKAVFRVPHGCNGSPTVALRIRIPDGVISVKPQPKPGWQIATVKGAYDKPYDYYGNTLTEGVREVDFTGGNLPDDFYDEFVFNAFLTGDLQAGTVLYFPLVQECVNGTERWIEIPAAGKVSDDYETPAPGVKLIARTGDDD
jgi:periplasmic copper chaperone A